MKFALSAVAAFFVLASSPQFFASAADGPNADSKTGPAVGIRSNVPQRYAITGVEVVTGTGRTLEDATIVVDGTLIVSVKAGGDVPDGFEEIDLSDHTVYPGFIDAYSERAFEEADERPATAYWNGNIRADFDSASALNSSDVGKSEHRKQGFVAQLISPSSGIIRGTSSIVSLGRGDVEDLVLADSVALHGELTLSRRGGRDSYPNSPMGAVALSRQAFYDAQWLVEAEKAARRDSSVPAPEANVTLSAMRPALDGEQPLILESSNALFALRADDFAREFGLDLIVRGSGREYRRLDEVAATGRPIIVPVRYPKAPDVDTPEDAASASLRALMDWDLAPGNLAMLEEAGVTVMLTSHGLTSTSDFLKNLRTAVDRGFSEESALAALTRVPAAAFGIEDHLGTIEPGKLASFVVTDGDLFASKTKVAETWVAGERFDHVTDVTLKPAGEWRVDLGRTPDVKTKELKLTIKGEKKLSAAIAPFDASTATDEQAEKKKPKKGKKGKKSKKKAKAVTDGGESDGGESDGGESDDEDKASEEADGKDAASNPISVKSPTLKDGVLTGTFKSDDLGLRGTASFSITAIEGENEWLGKILWPTGQRSSLTVTKVEKPDEPADLKKGEPSDEDVTKDPPSSEKSLPEGKPDEANEVVDEADEDSDEEESDDEEEAKSEKDEKAVRSRPASFDVNFPLGAFGVSEQPEAGGVVAITNATVWTSGEAGIVKNATVLIEDGVIAAVGTDVDVPKDATVVDAKGKHVTPGLIDCHSHIASDGGINESGQAITAEVRIADFVDPDDVDIYWQLAGGLTTSNILHGSANPIGGQNQVIKMRWGGNYEDLRFDEAPQGVKFALGENVKQSNWGSNYTTRYPQTRMGVEQIFRDEFNAAKEYAARREEYEETKKGLPPRRDLELDAIAEILSGDRWVHCHSYRQDEILALIRVLDEFEVTIGSFQHILEGYKVAKEMAEHGATGSSFSDWWAYKVEVTDAIPHNGAIMHDQGIVVSFNSDDGELGRRMNHEAAKAVKYGGVDPAEALKFVTLNPAIQLRIDDYVGSIEVGKHADIAIWSGDPLSNFSVCEQTWIDGAKYFDRAEQQKQAAEVAKMRHTLIQKIVDGRAEMLAEGETEEDPSSLWPRHDEFCGHHDHFDDGHDHEHE